MENKKDKIETYTITVLDDDKEYSCILKELDRETLSAVLGFMMPINGHPNYLAAGDIILLKCWVSGAEEIRKIDYLKTAASMQAVTLIAIKQASIKKN